MRGSHSTMEPPQCHLYLPLTHYQVPTFLPNCTRGVTLQLALLRQTLSLSPRRRQTLVSSLWDGANMAASIWNIQQGALRDERFGPLVQAMGLVTSADLTHLTVATSTLRHTAELALHMQNTLWGLIEIIIEAGDQLAWDSVCSQFQQYLTQQVQSIQEDVLYGAWPGEIHFHSGIPWEQWPFRCSWKLTNWKYTGIACSFTAFGPMKGMWTPDIKIQPGLWEGCLWDWVVHRDVWEVALPNDTAKWYVLMAAPDIWIAEGNTWQLWPMEPPQMMCKEKVMPVCFYEVGQHICWAGEASGYAPT
ncbi:uncharacterized protein LOC117883402 [Trachemys scripta elegans]|uniref:uncharacterized protein LOC117883402 n=1 Tax=Trachemys scripta elegans TaxID=31138 RepID=UPI001554FF21|nr:uncharacterized protein LOC117883402 [Trachemys scripta elegans]